MVKPKARPRDADATKARILAAAKAEFAANGLGGARVDEIAAKAEANKRMIYHYFGSKEELFRTVLEQAYLGIRNAEQELRLEHLPAKEALLRLVEFTWRYYLDNPEFITLVNSENLHRARHLKQTSDVTPSTRRLVHMVQEILDRGAEDGTFRPDVDAVQLNITIAAIGYYYITNRFTGSLLFERDLMASDALDERLAFNLDTIWRMVRADE